MANQMDRFAREIQNYRGFEKNPPSAAANPWRRRSGPGCRLDLLDPVEAAAAAVGLPPRPRAYETGKRSWKQAPPAGASDTATEPPWASATARTSVSPKPKPLCERLESPR